jgi:hypothetical protein
VQSRSIARIIWRIPCNACGDDTLRDRHQYQRVACNREALHGSSGAFRVMPAAITRYGIGININVSRAIAKHCTDHPAHSV